jgi:hypothetical protein
MLFISELFGSLGSPSVTVIILLAQFIGSSIKLNSALSTNVPFDWAQDGTNRPFQKSFFH